MKISQLLSRYYGEEPDLTSEGSVLGDVRGAALDSHEGDVHFQSNENIFSRVRQVKKRIDSLESELFSTREALFTQLVAALDQLDSLGSSALLCAGLPAQVPDLPRRVEGVSSVLIKHDTLQAATHLRAFKHSVEQRHFQLNFQEVELFSKYVSLTGDQVFADQVRKSASDRLTRLLASTDESPDLSEVLAQVKTAQAVATAKPDTAITEAVRNWTEQRCLGVLQQCSSLHISDYLEWARDEVTAAGDFLAETLEVYDPIDAFTTKMLQKGLVSHNFDLTVDDVEAALTEARLPPPLENILATKLLDIALIFEIRRDFSRLQPLSVLDAATASACERISMEILADVLMKNEQFIRLHSTSADCSATLVSLLNEAIAVIHKAAQVCSKDNAVIDQFTGRIRATLFTKGAQQIRSIAASFFGNTLEDFPDPETPSKQ